MAKKDKAEKANKKSEKVEKAEAASEHKYGVSDIAEKLGLKEASVRVQLRNKGVEKAGKSYGWDTKGELQEVIDQLKTSTKEEAGEKSEKKSKKDKDAKTGKKDKKAGKKNKKDSDDD